MLFNQVPNQKHRYGHFHPEIFKFLAAAYNATVVITEHGYRFAGQIRTKNALARDRKMSKYLSPMMKINESYWSYNLSAEWSVYRDLRTPLLAIPSF